MNCAHDMLALKQQGLSESKRGLLMQGPAGPWMRAANVHSKDSSCKALQGPNEEHFSHAPPHNARPQREDNQKETLRKGGMGDKKEARNTIACAPPLSPQGNIGAKPPRKSCVLSGGSLAPPLKRVPHG